ncbi:conserved Plasmodium protein, unknown function [Plasmodium berghei]|uniref:Uncharacterized protein n=2 Tax=Plasmodium berghei TaxID=5821 RepID=A0A509AJY7_PLABA|nr:conserved Plasmodium protein, unknown function [Plasmodium berghei ANKA]CXI26495.1 conserved Plasmodium protein, unknown function [Plasmodium berghei]SCM20506.1 conserved Plasmodium protein, unknown function [Plasmodium berghei]SCN24083.1 conserved Plasmodium protein, unknown function [Plasmodium berghei]SCO59388.1 conserved Plasmodium protein, unknown function [Plasmodium berghei]SCO60565.1 conserved Plasmodium protein, unknown function [Plasmodium berghei]|eukprot:XP_034420925.1 conserved Plasmodium protein, unknown function [Plasmodium berghei ANKA]
MQYEKGDNYEGNSYIVPKWKQNINSNELGWKNKIGMNCQNNNIDIFCNKNENKIVNNCEMYPLICGEDKDIKNLKFSIVTSLNKLKKNNRSKVTYYKEYESENFEGKDINNIRKESIHYESKYSENEEIQKCRKNNNGNIFQASKIIQKNNKSNYDLEPQVIIENMNKAINNSEFIKNMNYYFEEINSNTQLENENNKAIQADKTFWDINIEKDKLNKKELPEFIPKINYNDKNNVNFIEKTNIENEKDLLKDMNAHVYAFKEHCDYLKLILNELKDLMHIIYTCFKIKKNDNCLEKQINSTTIINKCDEYFTQNPKEINLHDHVSKNKNFQKELFYCKTLKINDEQNIYSSEIYVNCLNKFMKNELSIALENIRNILNNPNCEINKEGVNKIKINNLQLANDYIKTEYITKDEQNKKENQNNENSISILSISKLVSDMSYIRQYIEELKMNCIKENKEVQVKIKKEADSSENKNKNEFDGQNENNKKYQNKISELEKELLNTKLLLAQSETIREIEINEIKKSKCN